MKNQDDALFAYPEQQLGLTGRPLVVREAPAALEKHGPAKILAMCNQKGGVGKTTSTINLGAALALAGRKVLLVDLDPQGALSAGLGLVQDDLDLTIYNLMIDDSTHIAHAIHHTGIKNLDLVPANIDLSAAEIQLVNEVGREQALHRALRPVLKDYDYVLLDCQPSLGLLTVNALTCAQGVIIPMQCAYFSLRGLSLLMDTVEKVRDRLNFNLSVVGILVTMYDRRTSHSREVMRRTVEVFEDLVFDSVITQTVRFSETSCAGEPILTWAPNSEGAKQYQQLAYEVIERTSSAG